MNTKVLLIKLKLYPLATAAFALSLILVVVFYFRMMSSEEQDRTHTQLQAEWNKLEVNVFKNSVNLETHLEMAETSAQDARDRLILPTELARNYQYFYRMEAATGVEIIALQQQPSEPKKDAPKGKGSKKEPDPLFTKTTYTMTVAGSFTHLLEFFYALRYGENFFQLKRFTLQPTKQESDESLSATMNFDLLSIP